jgi:hypothetical protein
MPASRGPACAVRPSRLTVLIRPSHQRAAEPGRTLDRTRQTRRPRHDENPTAAPPWSPLAWCWLLSLSGVASRMLPPGVVLISVRTLILEL